MLTIKAAFNVYSSFPAIYSFVPSIGSINQNTLALFLIFRSTVSSEITGMFGVIALILLVINSFTLRSPLLTGDLSSLISIFKPCLKRSIEMLPASLNVSIKLRLMVF